MTMDRSRPIFDIQLSHSFVLSELQLHLTKSLKRGAHCAIFNSPLRSLLVRLYEHDPHVTPWDLSCPICQIVRQSRRVKNGHTLENLRVLHHQPILFR